MGKKWPQITNVPTHLCVSINSSKNNQLGIFPDKKPLKSQLHNKLQCLWISAWIQMNYCKSVYELISTFANNFAIKISFSFLANASDPSRDQSRIQCCVKLESWAEQGGHCSDNWKIWRDSGRIKVFWSWGLLNWLEGAFDLVNYRFAGTSDETRSIAFSCCCSFSSQELAQEISDTKRQGLML